MSNSFEEAPSQDFYKSQINNIFLGASSANRRLTDEEFDRYLFLSFCTVKSPKYTSRVQLEDDARKAVEDAKDFPRKLDRLFAYT